jgi:transcriptional regulator
MYVPDRFAESRPEVLHQLIRNCPLGALVTHGPSGLDANHLPFHLDLRAGAHGSLLAHVARANPVWAAAKESPSALILFQGPSSYISPSWYPTKKENGKAVPTWNYVVVHAHGRLVVHDDPAWVRSQLERLTAQMEGGRDHPWSIADAPAGYIDGLVKSIVGVELVIERIAGKWKTSQNQPAQNRDGVAAALEATGDTRAAEMARLVRATLN